MALFNRALALAPCSGWAHYDGGRILALSGQYKTEHAELERAQGLAGNDADLKARVAEVLSSENLLTSDDPRKARSCRLIAGPRSATIPFAINGDDPHSERRASLLVQINGVKAKLMLDTADGEISVTMRRSAPGLRVFLPLAGWGMTSCVEVC